VHEFAGPTRADDAGDRIGEGKTWERRNDDVVAICSERFEKSLKFEK
jgi:hypothetical protein